MKTRIFLLSLILSFLVSSVTGQTGKNIKVACIGNSITYGAGIKKREKNSYPAQLQKMLDDKYTVKNFGVSGRTLLSKGDHPYIKEQAFKNSLEWEPDIVIIMLGTNDSKPQNRIYIKDDFEKDYLKLIKAFDTLPSHPEIYVVAPVPVFKQCCGIQNDVVKNEVYPIVKKIANEEEIHFIDLFNKMSGYGNLFPDGVHPDAKGSEIMAKIIFDNIKIEKEPLKCADYHIHRGDLCNSFVKFEKEKKGTIAFLGGSITYNPGWRDSVCNYFKNRFPETEFKFIAAGISSFGSTENAFRLERDVLSKGPVDLLFVESAVNDAGKRRSKEEILRAMEGIVVHTRKENPKTDIIFMYFADPRKIKDYNSGKVPEIIQLHEKVAKHYNIPAINLAKEVTDRINAGEFTWKNDFKSIHPSPFGQGIYARSIIKFLTDSFITCEKENKKIENHIFPSIMDEFCYDKGKLIPAKEIKPAKGWKFYKIWKPEIEAKTRDNFVDVPMLAGSYPVKPLEFTFKGTAVGIAVAAGPDAGIVEYKIDEGEWKTKNLFTQHSKIYYLPWYYVLEDTLQYGNHTLKLRLSQEKDKNSLGQKCIIRYFLVNE